MSDWLPKKERMNPLKDIATAIGDIASAMNGRK